MKKVKTVWIVCILVIIYIIVNSNITLALDKSRRAIGADLVNDLGVTGEGSVICLIDDGVDYTHSNLGGCTKSQYELGNCSTVVVGRNIIDGDSDILPYSNQFHGTHIAGILISNDDKYRGIAPNAKLAVAKVFSDVTNSTNCQAFIDSIDWCVDKASQYNIAAISLSYGLDECENSYSSGFKRAINNATSKGISFIKSSGNRKPFQSYDTTFPAELGNVTTIGSVSKRNDINDFTRRDTNLDLLAPGHKIRSTKTGGGLSPFLNEIICFDDSISPLFGLCDSGTSYAAPHVSASVALAKQYDPALNPYMVEKLFKDTGINIRDSVTGLDFKKIDLLSAFGVIEWPTFHHDNRRTGFTLLRGDFDSTTNKKELTFEGNPATDFWDSPVIANIDRDDEGEIVVGTHDRFSTLGIGRVFAIDDDGDEKWSFDAGSRVAHSPVVADLDNNNKKEVVFGTLEGHRVYILNAKNGREKENYLVPKAPISGLRGYVFGIAVADINDDNENEIVFADFYPFTWWQASVYAIDKDGNTLWRSGIGDSTLSTGSQGAPAIADLDSDGVLDVVIASMFGVSAYNGDDGSLKWQRNDICTVVSTPVIADLDNDNKYEITVNSLKLNLASCKNATYVLKAEDGTTESGWPITHSYMPDTTPAVANLDGDANLEIVVGSTKTPDFAEDTFSGPTKGQIRILDGDTGFQQCSYTDSGSLDAVEGSPDILDIDGDDVFEIIFGTKNGYLYVIDKSCNFEWRKNLGSRMWNAPAIGDIDGDLQTAEIAVKHFTGTGSQSLSTTMLFGENKLKVFGGKYYNILTGEPAEEKFYESSISAMDSLSSTLSVIDGINEQPQLNFIEDIYAIENELVKITPTATDENNDTLAFSFTSPVNATGAWKTNTSDAGTYETFVAASDGNLTDSQVVTITVFENTTKLQNNFSNNKRYKNLTYNQPANQTVYINLSDDLNILRAAFKINGKSLSQLNNTYLEPTPVVINANELNATQNSTLLKDKNWSTFYSAGSQTGAIVEIGSLTIPANLTHIVYHLKLRVFMGGVGRFGIYNYNTKLYEITANVPAFNKSSKDVYFDVYKQGDSPLWANNDTHFSIEVSNINNYINVSKVRWYYKYIGDWASQKIYESEIRFEQKIIYPTSLSIDVGNNSIDFKFYNELHGQQVIINKLNNSKANEYFNNIPANTSVLRYLTIPINSELTRAILNVGNKTVSSLSSASVATTFEDAVQHSNPYDISKEIKLGNFMFKTNVVTKDNSVNLDLELIDKPKDEEITIRDVFVNTGRYKDGEMWMIGHEPVDYKFSKIGDSKTIDISLNKNISREFRYLHYNYYYVHNGKTENGEYFQYINATIK